MVHVRSQSAQKRRSEVWSRKRTVYNEIDIVVTVEPVAHKCVFEHQGDDLVHASEHGSEEEVENVGDCEDNFRMLTDHELQILKQTNIGVKRQPRIVDLIDFDACSLQARVSRRPSMKAAVSRGMAVHLGSTSCHVKDWPARRRKAMPKGSDLGSTGEELSESRSPSLSSAAMDTSALYYDRLNKYLESDECYDDLAQELMDEEEDEDLEMPEAWDMLPVAVRRIPDGVEYIKTYKLEFEALVGATLQVLRKREIHSPVEAYLAIAFQSAISLFKTWNHLCSGRMSLDDIAEIGADLYLDM